MPKASNDNLLNAVDLNVGARVRTRRKFLGLSQDDFAKALKLTVQQVQEHERGSKRIGASKLYEISRALEVPISYFFDSHDDIDRCGVCGQSQAVESVQPCDRLSTRKVQGQLATNVPA